MKKIVQFLMYILFSLLLICCVPCNFDGYSYRALDSGVYQVSIRTTGIMLKEHIQNLILAKAASLTLEKGYRYFIILATNTGLRVPLHEKYQEDPEYQKDTEDDSECTPLFYTTYPCTATFKFDKYTASVIIRMTHAKILYSIDAAAIPRTNEI